MSLPRLRFLCVVCLLAWTLPGPVLAQDEGETDEQQLPEIAPREIEIRGELRLSFPSLQRQPLRGFATPPTIPSVPPTRTPYVESYKQELDVLPESLPAPESVSQPVTAQKPPKRGILEFGGGRYQSRFLTGRLSLPLTENQRLSFRADYRGTDGHSPFDGADLSTPSDDIEGRVQFEHRHETVSFMADLHGTADRYTLYGQPSVVQTPSASAPNRTGRTGGTTLQLRTHGSLESDLQISYDQTRYETELDPTSDAATAFSDGRLTGRADVRFDISNTEVRLNVSGARSALGGDEPSSTASSIDGGGTIPFLDTDRLSVRGGGRLLVFSAPVDPSIAGSPSASAEFIVPEGRAELALGEDVTGHVQNTPGINPRGLADLYTTNPFAEHAPSLRPDLFTTDAEAGLTATLGLVRLQATTGYRYAPSYQFFETPSGPTGGVFEASYASAEILQGGVELALQGVRGVEASLGISVRDGEIVGDDADLPYFSPVIADAMVSVSFSNQRGLLQTTGTIKSPRPTDRTGSNEVDTYVSFDLEGSYEVTSLLDAVVRIRNIGPTAPEHWARYPRSPGSVMGGFRIHW